LAAASAIDLLRGAASGHKKTRFAHSSGRSRASMFAAALAAASGAYTTLPENVTRVNYSGRRADCNALLHGLPSHAHNAASARKLARKNLSSSGRTATTISRDRNVQPIVGRLRHRPYADRHCCGCHMSAPLGPRVAARKKERIRPKPGLSDCCKFSNRPLRPTRPISGWNDAKLKGSDVALGTTTRFGTPSLVLAPGAANWT
jgi:hypothetical protein